jgi:serine O-acetyltransferase
MIQSRRDLMFYLQEDAKRFSLQNVVRFQIKLIYGSEDAHILRYLKVLRRYEYYNNCRGNILKTLMLFYFRFRWMRLSLRYNLRIGINMVGYGFYMAHLTGGCIINCNSMGNYCSVNSGVIVGNKDNPSSVPTIGNNVKLSVGSKVFGKLEIGDNVVIAPNAVVVKSVLSNSIVGGVPARLIRSII